MISKSQEETEVSWHLEESTRSGSVAVKLANGVRSLSAAKVAAWPDIQLRALGVSPGHEV
jgi:hypothetical protein